MFRSPGICNKKSRILEENERIFAHTADHELKDKAFVQYTRTKQEYDKHKTFFDQVMEEKKTLEAQLLRLEKDTELYNNHFHTLTTAIGEELTSAKAFILDKSAKNIFTSSEHINERETYLTEKDRVLGLLQTACDIMTN
jgi:hypothetical protein